jgi:hypothetical protein
MLMPPRKPGWLSRTLGSVSADSIAAKLVSASSVTALLAGVAYQWRVGWKEGIAARRGIPADYIQLSSDPAATPVLIVALLLVVSVLACVAAMMVPAFTAWPIPAAVGGWYVLRLPWDLIRHSPRQLFWIDLITAAGLFLLAATVAVVSHQVRRLLRARRDERPARPLPTWLRLFVEWMDRHMPAWWDGMVTALQIVFMIVLVVYGAFWGASSFGTWLGRQNAQPDQAVISKDGHTYGLLGETSSGLMVVRPVDFCGASAPEAASWVRVTGKRSLLLDPEGLQVIRLRGGLRLVGQCPG